MAEEESSILASVLTADFADIGAAVALSEMVGVLGIHLDVMDGVFVPPITFGSQMAASIRARTDLPLDVHLMTANPEGQLGMFADAGVDRITFHVEAAVHSHRLIGAVRERGLKAGISLVPSTPVSAIRELLGIVDQVLVMTVNPGYGGQSLIPSMLGKVKELVQLRRKGLGEYSIMIDGGFSPATAAGVWEAGVDVAVMGSALLNAADPSAALEQCRPKDGRFKRRGERRR